MSSKTNTGRAGYVRKGGFIGGIITVALLFLTVTAAAGDINKNAGTTGFSFLKLGVGAKAVAMGGAFTAVADDPSAIYYNAAGTYHLEGQQFLAGYHNYVLDIQSGFLAYTRPLATGWKFGAFIDYMNYGDFTETDINGVPTGDFSGGDFLLGGNVSRQLGPMFTVGLNVKFITEFASDWSAQAMAADIGVLAKMPDSLTTVGFSAYNLGGVLSGFSSESDDDHKDKLPMGVRLGVSHALRELPLVVALDGVLPNDNDPYVNVGTEFYHFQPLYLRLGYSTFGDNYKTGSDSDGWGGFSFGFGLDYQKYHFSYAFMPYLDLGSSHRLTVTGEF